MTLTLAGMATEMIERKVRRIHVLGWRDLDDPEAGGSEVHADEVMRRWQEAGLEVLHRTSQADGRSRKSTRNGYQVIRDGGRIAVFPRTILAEMLRRMGPYDAVVEIWNGVPWLTPLWCRKPHIAVLHHVHDRMWEHTLPEPAAWAGRKFEMVLSPLLYRRTHTVTLCEDSRGDLLDLGWDESFVHVARAGVDDYFSPGGPKTSYPSVLAVGRLAPVKRFDALLDQFLVTRERVPGARLTIVGEGPERSKLEGWIARHGAQGWVTLAGRIDRGRLRDLYRSSWLIASASFAEGWGLTLTEAAGCGTPAVVTDIGGHRSSVFDGVTGSLVGLDQLGRRCSDLLLDDSSRSRMSNDAQSWARSLSWDETATRVLEPLHDVVIGRK